MQALQEERLWNEPPSPSDYEKPQTYLKDQTIGFDNENPLSKPSDDKKPQESFKKRPNAFEYVKLLRNKTDGLQTTNLKVCTSLLYFPVCISHSNGQVALFINRNSTQCFGLMAFFCS